MIENIIDGCIEFGVGYLLTMLVIVPIAFPTKTALITARCNRRIAQWKSHK